MKYLTIAFVGMFLLGCKTPAPVYQIEPSLLPIISHLPAINREGQLAVVKFLYLSQGGYVIIAADNDWISHSSLGDQAAVGTYELGSELILWSNGVDEWCATLVGDWQPVDTDDSNGFMTRDREFERQVLLRMAETGESHREAAVRHWAEKGFSVR